LLGYVEDWQGLLRGNVQQGQQVLRRLLKGRMGFEPQGDHWHCQLDVEQAGSAPDEATSHSSASDAGLLSPDTAGPCSQEPMMDGPQVRVMAPAQ